MERTILLRQVGICQNKFQVDLCVVWMYLHYTVSPRHMSLQIVYYCTVKAFLIGNLEKYYFKSNTCTYLKKRIHYIGV